LMELKSFMLMLEMFDEILVFIKFTFKQI